jgi:hypothetical protein
MKREDPEQRMLRRLFARLRKDPTVVRCGTTYVDVPGTIERKVACADGLCARGLRGRALAGKTCCTTFDVPVEAKDVRRIAKILPEVRAIRDVGAAIDRAGGFWVFEDGERRLRTRPGGACVFFSAPPGEAPRCTIHEWAALRGLEHREWKPETCCLFPLYLVEWGEDAFVTGYGSRWFLEIEPDERDEVKSFACLHPPTGGRALLAEQEEELRYRLGARRWGAMLRKLRALGHPV